MDPQLPTLDALREIHLPEPISFWPLAPGWWLLAALILSAGIALAAVLRRRRNSPTRAALRELDGLEASYRQSCDPVLLAVDLSKLLRRLCLVRFPREDVASSSGAMRADFLALDGHEAGIPAEVIAAIEKASFRDVVPESEPAETDRWIAATRRFINAIAKRKAPPTNTAPSAIGALRWQRTRS